MSVDDALYVAAGEARPQLTSEEFRNVIGHFVSGVTVVTTSHDGRSYGTTASAMTSLSLDPPMLVLCMNKASETGRAVGRSGLFAVNILSEDQSDLAVRFATKEADKFADAPTTDGPWRQPLLNGALAVLECRVVEAVAGGTHTVFVSEVLNATARHGSPLAYFRGRFGHFHLDGDNNTP
ncbi:flavin reductase family protein [Streptomyces sp. NPDC002143]